MGLSVQNFVEQWVSAGFIAAEPAKAFLAALPQVPESAEQLARLLTRDGRLTAFQAQMLLQGKGKSLSLGNYVLVDRIGQGGMGLVFKAEHRRMERIVALKVLPPNVVKSPDLVDRFLREAKAAARLLHPNIVTAFDADEAKGTHFLVMEYVDGLDLASLVRRSGVMNVDQAVDCIGQAARGLQFAHEQGVIHRDIKPANLLLDVSGTIKILDMGLARIEGDVSQQAELTGTGVVMGTIDYMSPEQSLSTKSADSRSDIYSLGITLYFLLTAKPAYLGDSLMARMLAHRDAPIPSLRDARPDVPDWLDTVFSQMVAKQPADRFQSMAEVLEALQNQGVSLRTRSGAGKTRVAGSGVQALVKKLESEGAQTGRRVSLTPTVVPDADRPSSAEPTIISGDASGITDPVTQTRKIASAAPGRTKPKANSKKMARRKRGGPWTKPKVLISGGCILLALIALPAFLRPNRDAPRAAPLDQPGSAVAVSRELLETAPSSREPVSPTEAGWTHLFDGTRTAGWKVLGPFHVENGLLIATARGLAVTEQAYADFELEFEWRVAKGGNSGVYYRVDPAELGETVSYPGTEFQLLDNARHLDGQNPKTSAGALYGMVPAEGTSVHPAGEWNTSRIVARGPHVEHWMNGQQTVSYDIGSATWQALATSAKDAKIAKNAASRSGCIALQGHTGEVAFRNMRIREIADVAPASVRDSMPAPAIVDGLRFDGVDDYIAVPSLKFDGAPLTLEAWVTPTRRSLSRGEIYQTIAGWHGRAHLFLRCSIDGDFSAFAQVWEAGSGKLTPTVTGEPLAPQQRHHVALVIVGNRVELYTNGKLSQRTTVKQLKRGPLEGEREDNFLIGAYRSCQLVDGQLSRQYFSGMIHNLHLSRKSRLPAQVNPGKFVADADTIALYDFSQGSGNVLKDASLHGHDGQIYGATWVKSAGEPTIPAGSK